MGLYPFEWQDLSLCSEDLFQFKVQFSGIVLQLLPFAEGPVSFLESGIEKDAPDNFSAKPKYWNKYIKRVEKLKRPVSAKEKPILFMPVWDSGNIIGITVVEGVDPQFVHVLSEEWLSDRSRVISREFFLQKQLYFDPVTAMFNSRYLRDSLDNLLAEFFPGHKSHRESPKHSVPSHVSLFFMEIHPRANNAEKALHSIVRAGYHLESFLGRNVVYHLGNGVFGFIGQELDEERAQKLGKNILGWFRREGVSRIHLSINTIDIDANMPIHKIQTEFDVKILLEQTWEALRKASRRGPYALCTYNSISNPEKQPLKKIAPAVRAKLRKHWDVADVFALILLSQDIEGDGDGFPKRLLALIEAEVPVVPINGNEIFVFLEDEDPQSAKSWFRNFKKRLPADLATTYSAGIAYYPCIDFKKTDIPLNCRKALLHASFFGPDSTVVFDGVSQNVSGDIYYGEGDLIRAVKEYRKGLEIDGTNINLLNSLGETYARMNNPKKARPFFEKILQLDPKHYMALFNIGITYLTTGDDEEAIKYFERTLSVSRRRPKENQLNDLLLQLSKLYCRTGRYKKAVTLLEKEYILDDKSREVLGRSVLLRYLGEAYSGIKKNNKAIMVLQRAVSYNPHDAYSLSLLGELYNIERQGDDIALSLCRQAVEIDDRYWRHWYRLAVIQYKLGQFDAALEAVRECLQRDRKCVEALQLAAQIYEKSGMRSKSIGIYKRILKIIPDHKAAAAAIKQ